MRSGKAIAIKRINKDMKEINKSPVEGIGIASIENDPMQYVVNLRLMSGPYEGYCLQLYLTFTDNFPTKPPKILIYPGQAIDGQYHHHIFQDYSKDENGHCFKKFCFDLLDNDFMSTSVENSGWNPSYTISCLLLQVQNFLCDPDMPVNHLPSKDKINQLMNSMKNYKRSFKIINDNNEEQTIVHTWKKPYPKMYFKKDDKKNNEDNKNEDKNEQNKKEEQKMQIIKENLTCFMLKLNYIDDPDILLGYPIVQCVGLGKNKIELYPIPELLTYDGYMAQIGKQDSKLDFYFDTHFKSANNQYYNYWVPIYIDKHHYEKNRAAILNSFSIIKYGPLGIKEYDFKPEQIFEILPIILSKMIIGMFNGKSNISSAFITCYFQYALLLKKLIIEFEDEYLKYSNHILNLIKKNNYNVDKKIIPDIGNFFVLLFFSTKDTHCEKMKKMWYVLFEEYLTREMYWLFHGEECKAKIRKMILKNKEPSDEEINDSCFKYFETNPDFKMRYLYEFNQDCDDEKIFKTIVNIISTDKEFLSLNKPYNDNDYNAENEVTQRMSRSFKRLFNECSQNGKKRLKDIISKHLNFSEYFELGPDFEVIDDLYDNCQVNILLRNLKAKMKNKKEILDYAFKSQKGNSLLIITFFALKKIEEKGFLEELEKNYGIYLDVDNFIKEMNKKLKEIKSFKEMFQYVGSEFGIDKSDDLEIIIEGYERAQRKGYIRQNSNNSNLGNSQNFRGGFAGRGRGGRGGRGERGGRGRGRGRGRGGY